MNKNARPKWERLLGSFQKFARTVVRTSGHPTAFGLAIGIIVIWALTGPFFLFSNTWLLVIDTIANIITFLMIFLIRNAQNRESEAVQLKLDELIRATKTATNSLLDIEELTEEELDGIKARFERLARKARAESGTNPPNQESRPVVPAAPEPAGTSPG